MSMTINELKQIVDHCETMGLGEYYTGIEPIDPFNIRVKHESKTVCLDVDFADYLFDKKYNEGWNDCLSEVHISTPRKR